MSFTAAWLATCFISLSPHLASTISPGNQCFPLMKNLQFVIQNVPFASKISVIKGDGLKPAYINDIVDYFSHLLLLFKTNNG